MAYIMLDYMKMDIDTIIAWCKDNNQVEWLKAKAAEKKIGKDGEERSISFVELKIDFCKEFVPEIIPKSKPKAPNMFEKIAAL